MKSSGHSSSFLQGHSFSHDPSQHTKPPSQSSLVLHGQTSGSRQVPSQQTWSLGQSVSSLHGQRPGFVQVPLQQMYPRPQSWSLMHGHPKSPDGLQSPLQHSKPSLHITGGFPQPSHCLENGFKQVPLQHLSPKPQFSSLMQGQVKSPDGLQSPLQHSNPCWQITGGFPQLHSMAPNFEQNPLQQTKPPSQSSLILHSHLKVSEIHSPLQHLNPGAHTFPLQKQSSGFRHSSSQQKKPSWQSLRTSHGHVSSPGF